MAFTCDHCGFRSNEVKAGGGTAEKGVRHVLKCSTIEDLNRDVLKSETAAIIIPELNLEVVHGSLGGRFSTIEGLLKQVKTELKNNPWIMGDSALGNTSMPLSLSLCLQAAIRLLLTAGRYVRLLQEVRRDACN